MSRIVVPKDCVSSYMQGYLKISTAEQIVLNEKVKTKMASRSSLSSSQPRLHGACLLPGHILVNERFHGSAVVKALQGWSGYLVHGVFVVQNGYRKVRAKIQILQPVI